MSQAPQWGIPEWTMGDRLRKALDFADMSVQDMADYLEVKRNTVGNYIAGRTSIPGGFLRLWALRTGVPREWLETGTAPRPEPGGQRARRDSNPQPSDPKVLRLMLPPAA